VKNRTQKIFFFDVGNTLVEKPSNHIDNKLVRDILSLRENGNIIGLATMRNLAMLDEILSQIQFDFIITLNGAYVECKKEILIDTPINRNELSQILNAFVFLNIDYNIYSKYYIHKSIIPNEQYYGIEIKECYNEVNNLQKVFNSFVFHIWEKGKNCDVHSLDISKCKGMLEVCKYFDIPLKNSIVFGDGYNDIEMFKKCGKSIAMGSAPKELKEIASFITKSVSENGVSWALKHFQL
jgi:HAD superfamily hydrolase (TIGR01484 family)